MHALLRHLKRVGFPGSPRVVGDGYDDQGREVLTYIKGRIAHPRPYTDEAILVTRMIEFAVRDCAGLATVKQITERSNDSTTLWTLAWQTRAAAWMLRHRPLLERAMQG